MGRKRSNSESLEPTIDDRKRVIRLLQGKDAPTIDPAVSPSLLPLPLPPIPSSRIESALLRYKGLQYLSADYLGITRADLAARLAEDERLREIAADQRGKLLDKAESKLMDAIENGEQWAITLALKTIGRDRGFVERQEISNIHQVRLQIVEEIIDINGSSQIEVKASYIQNNLPQSFNSKE